jgi:hypothetical protein
MERRVETVEVGVVTEGLWVAWPVYWSGVWVGALASLALAMVFGLVGTAVGAHQLGTAGQITKWSDVARSSVAFIVFGAFLSSALGGWTAGKVAGIRRSEPAMLHGAITWLVVLPLLLVLLELGGGGAFGGWYGGLAGTPAWAPVTNAPIDPNVAITARNAALAAVTAVLLGLAGSVVGGWLASGEPMTFTHYRTRDTLARHPR